MRLRLIYILIVAVNVYCAWLLLMHKSDGRLSIYRAILPVAVIFVILLIALFSVPNRRPRENKQGQVLGLGVEAREAPPEDPKEKSKNADGKTEHK